MNDANEWRGKLRKADHAISGAVMLLKSFLQIIKVEETLSRFEELRRQFAGKAWGNVDEKIWNDELDLARGMIKELEPISKVIHTAEVIGDLDITGVHGRAKSALDRMHKALEELNQATTQPQPSL